jgi:hypothetical protein
VIRVLAQKIPPVTDRIRGPVRLRRSVLEFPGRQLPERRNDATRLDGIRTYRVVCEFRGMTQDKSQVASDPLEARAPGRFRGDSATTSSNAA